jgi:hypothetical protein
MLTCSSPCCKLISFAIESDEKGARQRCFQMDYTSLTASTGGPLTIIRENNGATLWLRDFATVQSALDILEDDILAPHERSDVEFPLSRRRGFYTAEFNEPEEGFDGYAFRRYIRAASN